uniref:Glutamate decarboxylase 2 n=1 Tax=Scleropages formosus TaxID=113540 RepID=A0A8C9T994_SCLFO
MIGFADLLPMTDGDLATMTFLQDVVDIMLGYIVKSFDRSTKVIDFQYPNELLQMNNWELSDEPETLDDVLVNCRATLEYAVKTAHPRYFNQLSTGLDMVGLAADWLTSTANTNMFTYEVAPVFVLLEYVTLKKMREIIGWQDGHGDGIFSPGGAISNMYAMLLRGMASLPRLAAFTSETRRCLLAAAASHMTNRNSYHCKLVSGFLTPFNAPLFSESLLHQEGSSSPWIGTESVICVKVDERRVGNSAGHNGRQRSMKDVKPAFLLQGEDDTIRSGEENR